MVKEKLEKLKMQLSSLKIATKKPVCKICFEEFIPQSFQNFYDNPEI